MLFAKHSTVRNSKLDREMVRWHVNTQSISAREHGSDKRSRHTQKQLVRNGIWIWIALSQALQDRASSCKLWSSFKTSFVRREVSPFILLFSFLQQDIYEKAYGSRLSGCNLHVSLTCQKKVHKVNHFSNKNFQKHCSTAFISDF